MSSLDLSKQVGPLPLGAWLAVVAGGLGIAWYTRRNTTADPAPVVDTSGINGVGDGSVGGWANTTPAATQTSNPVVQTNEAWAVQAINWLIAQGYPSTVSDSAIRKYINATGNKSIQEWSLISLVLTHFGSPPNPLPPTEDGPGPVYGPGPEPPPTQAAPPVTQPPPAAQSVAAPAPAQQRYYTVKRGDNLWNIAKAYYGNGAQYVRIFNANRNRISNPNLIQPGWVLLIP
jgi:hypothetical protein